MALGAEIGGNAAEISLRACGITGRSQGVFKVSNVSGILALGATSL